MVLCADLTSRKHTAITLLQIFGVTLASFLMLLQATEGGDHVDILPAPGILNILQYNYIHLKASYIATLRCQINEGWEISEKFNKQGDEKFLSSLINKDSK